MRVLDDDWTPPGLPGLTRLPDPADTPDTPEKLPAQNGGPRVDEQERPGDAAGSGFGGFLSLGDEGGQYRWEDGYQNVAERVPGRENERFPGQGEEAGGRLFSGRILPPA